MPHGWPKISKSVEFGPYFRRYDSITCLENRLLWGNTVIILEQDCGSMLKLLHPVYQGICSMKAKTRSVI